MGSYFNITRSHTLLGILAVLLAIATGCTRAEEESSRLQLKVPDKIANHMFQVGTYSATSPWGLAQPTTLTEIDCYAIFLTPTNGAANTCYDANNYEVAKLSGLYGLYSAGSVITIDVPSGAERTVSILAFNSAGSCNKTLASNFNSIHYSAPLIVGKKDVVFTPGDVNVNINISLTNAATIETCKGPLFGMFSNNTWPALGTSTTPPSTPSLTVTQITNSLDVAGNTGSVVVDSAGNIFYGSVNGYVIKKIAPDGTETVFAGSGTNGSLDGTGVAASFLQPTLLAIDTSDNIYVGDAFLVRKITPAGVVTTKANLSGGTFRGITADSAGNVYTTFDNGSTTTHLIKKIDPGGTITTLAGSTGSGSANGTGAAAQFYYPYGLATDSSGNVYVADTFNYLIRKITPAGVVTTFAGSGVPGTQDGIGVAASFSFYNSYSHMAVDSNDNIYLGDMDFSTHNTIRKITSTGVVTTYCGPGSASTNTGAAIANIYSRFGVGVSNTGIVYFADTSTLYKIVP